MNQEPNQPLLFGSEVNPPVPWRTYATSLTVHVVAVVLLLVLIPIAVTRDVKEPMRLVTTLIAPQLKPYKPEPPKIRPPKLLTKSIDVPKPLQAPPKVEPKPVVAPPVIKDVPKPIPQPQIAAAEPKPIPRVARPEMAPAPALKPEVHTGVFGSEQAAKKVETPKELKVGGFGDPNGVKPAPETTAPTLMAKVGGFDAPQGDGSAGGRGGAGRGTVRQSSFGTMDGAGSGPGGIGHGAVRQSGFGSADGGGNGSGGNGRGGTVKTGGFGETAAGPTQTVQKPKTVAPTTTAVEILSKPKPVYTAEARALHLEGEVSLDVVFSASGSVQILRVVQGLGHGLDEAAQSAASHIHFRPGTRDGTPVDTRATIRIVFQLT
jgi:TonB family protein